MPITEIILKGEADLLTSGSHTSFKMLIDVELRKFLAITNDQNRSYTDYTDYQVQASRPIS